MFLRIDLKDSFNGSGQMINGGGMSSDPRALLSEQARANIPETVLNKIIDALAGSIGYTFSWGLIPAVLVVLFVFLLTNDRLAGSKKKI